MNLLCEQNEWDDSIELLTDNADTALTMLGEVCAQYAPHDCRYVYVYAGGICCIGYVEE